MAHKYGGEDWTKVDVVKYLKRTTKKATVVSLMERYPGMTKGTAQAYVANQTMGRYNNDKTSSTKAAAKPAKAATKRSKAANKATSNTIVVVVGHDADLVAETTEKLSKLDL